ncbi:MAG: hypothetical protein LBC85_07325 [Fibromonadaceae bacterium]|nr:hypothetical protein [Fibromonadaceae bacterium]
MQQQGSSDSLYEQELKANPHFAEFVKKVKLKLVGTKLMPKETQNGHATDASLNAEDAISNEEDAGGLAEPEL